MKPTWDKLIEEYAGVPGALIADVDCTTAGKALCSQHGIRGYPTIKYGDPSDLKDYSGARDFDSLLEFAKENLKPLPEASPMEKTIKTIKAKMRPEALLDLVPSGALKEDVKHILELRKNAAIVLLVAGFLLGVFSTRCCCPRRVVTAAPASSAKDSASQKRGRDQTPTPRSTNAAVKKEK
mmetsp:Transcript_42015/g.75466  ORF Transcript_42015/g.75466 Transcript_42015/m.75466 type:complete len:181 (-) Transcript_42015:107-649(-)|eukprot:CAMPEP_0197624894 /NCGR_PEP_ID=MMETSP1338-20131121/4402_1 /TAXON_ID=43686 ORGANISM="Pelagodinium beii, Strain RCC1491" /NCGR_SAMPLE_ID=MMETSP1338 /ASSEMBLY_ACC=CAM_ASM_000754 /LENGTH=180 /DNA_ID=CAMNT_0043195147 /DNA_START=171 /DNA_END=713 /DNA_ORIENTATION=+